MDILSRLHAPVPAPFRDFPGVWLVGGAVRDALLGREPRELDLVVEGDAVALAQRLDPGAVVHPRFGTARVGGIDLTSARRETYARPGALPDVILGATLQEDLARRDFTVNAMAVRLADGEWAEWPGARADLEARRLRVLHPRSFADDPTRMLRGVRYAARLGFTLDAPLEPELLATVSRQRVGTELRLALREPLVEVLGLLDATGLGAAALGAFRADPPLLERVLALCPPEASAGLACLGACLDGRAAALDGLGLTARERAVLAAVGDAVRAAGAPPPHGWRKQPLEAAAVAAALGDESATEWLTRLRHVRVAITGDDLLAAGLTGPDVGAALERAWAVAAAGGDREAQLRAALQS